MLYGNQYTGQFLLTYSLTYLLQPCFSACVECVRQACSILNSTRMTCISPSLRLSSLNATALSSSSPPVNPLCYGFIMDAVLSLRNVSTPAVNSRMFQVFADPVFRRFDDGFKSFFFLPNEYLTINVRIATMPLACCCEQDWEEDPRVRI